MAHAIDNAIAGRASTIGLEETDSGSGITCTYHATWHFYAASAIKATILAALLRKAQEQHRSLTKNEKRLAWLMITQSTTTPRPRCGTTSASPTCSTSCGWPR